MSRDSDRKGTYRRYHADRTMDEVAARKRQLGRIHQAKKTLGLDDATYRSLLERVTGLTSSADMTSAQRNAVLAEFVRLGFKAERAVERASAFQGRPKNIAEVPMLRKVEALLAEGRKPWAYAHSLAKKMYAVEKVEWLNNQQLHRFIAALQTDANRKHKPRPNH